MAVQRRGGQAASNPPIAQPGPTSRRRSAWPGGAGAVNHFQKGGQSQAMAPATMAWAAPCIKPHDLASSMFQDIAR